MLEADSYHRMGDRWEDQEAGGHQDRAGLTHSSPHVSEATQIT